MLKWRDYSENGTLFEAFLPECDAEGISALLRAVRRGHVVAEHRVSLTWRPTFGPDGGDVQAMDAALDGMISDLASQEPPESEGTYVPGPVEIDEPDPYRHASLHALLEASKDAMTALEVSPEQVQGLLGLPNGCALDDLYPLAITPRRADGMHKAIALRRLLETHEALRARRMVVLGAMLRGDTVTVRNELEAAGISVGPATD
ncbi:MAG: hypothetical protein JSR92_16275 [Proteobacteria bacterium]|nr:hypothetical protein [Pseudomonadota bacterium]